MLVLDACVAINLRASRRWRQILGAGGWRALMPDDAFSEILYVFDAQGERVPASLDEEVENGQLIRCSLSEVELEVMISLSADLGRGEAAAIAVAKERGHPLATDDKAARRRVDPHPPGLFTTPELVRSWAGKCGLGPPDVRETVTLIESRAKFRPRSSDPDFPWWDSQSAPHRVD
jgi:hypothetical protein